MTNQPTREETPLSTPIEITANQRGFHQYGEPVRTACGDTVEVYESSTAIAPHCWLRIDGSTSVLTDQKGRDMTAHLNLEQAVAIRDQLNAWIDEVLTRWDCCETEARIAELSPRTVDAAGRERVREIVSGWVDGMQCHAVTDRIIDALGWTAAEPDPDADLKLKPGEVPPESKLLRRDLVVDDPAPVPPAPVIWDAPTVDDAITRFTEAWPNETNIGREWLTEALRGRIKELQCSARISSEELTAVLGAHIYGDRGPFTADPARFSVCTRAAEDLTTRYRVLRIGGGQ